MSEVVTEAASIAEPTTSPDASLEAAAALLRGEDAPANEATQAEEQPAPKQEEPKPLEGDEVTKKVAKSFAALSRQEKQFRQKVEEWKGEKAKIEGEIAELRALKEALSANDIAKLEAAGFSFEEAARRVLNGNKPSAESKLDAVQKKLEQIEQEKAREKAEAEKTEAERVQREAAENYRGQIKSVVDQDDRFELVRAIGAVQDVYDVTEAHFQQTGEILPIEEAAALVEKHLENEAEKLLQSKKLQSKLAPKPTVKPPNSGQQANQGPRTLQNSLAAEAPVRDKIEDLDEDSRLALAARILAGKAS